MSVFINNIALVYFVSGGVCLRRIYDASKKQSGLYEIRGEENPLINEMPVLLKFEFTCHHNQRKISPKVE